MSIVRRTLIFSAMTMTFAQPVMAQRGGQSRPPASRPDTTRKGVSLDFQDQDLKVVLDALAAAGDLNVSMTNIPQQRITVHMGRPVSREGMMSDLLFSIRGVVIMKMMRRTKARSSNGVTLISERVVKEVRLE